MIKELPYSYDHEQILDVLYSFKKNNWPDQIYVSSIDGKTYSYPGGDDFTIKYNYKESDFNIVNNVFKDTYVEEVYNDVSANYDVARCRFMILEPPMKRAYSYHSDISKRIHIPLRTDRNCMFLIEDIVHRMDKLGQAYHLDTTYKHSALNLGWEPRIHLMFSLL